MVDKNPHEHLRFSPGDQALLVRTCKAKGKEHCCVKDCIGQVVTVVDYCDNLIDDSMKELLQLMHDVLKMIDEDASAPAFHQDYLVAIKGVPALIYDHQLMPLGGHTEKTPEPEKPEVVH